MKTKFLLGFFFLTCSVSVSAQFTKVTFPEHQGSQYLYTNEDAMNASRAYSFRPMIASLQIDIVKFFDPKQKEDEVKGSPFLFPGKWVPGTITFNDSDTVFSSGEMNYCILLQQIWFKDKDDILALTDDKQVKEIVLNNNHTFVFKDFNGRSMLFELLVGTPVVALIRGYDARLYGPEPVTSGYGSGSIPTGKVETKRELYCWVIGQEPVQVPNTKEALIHIFPDYQAEIKGFVDKNKIKPNREKDLIKLFEYYADLTK